MANQKQTARISTAPRRQYAWMLTPKKRQNACMSTAPKIDTIKSIRPMKIFKHRPGALALEGIRRFQKSSEYLIKRLPFQRLVRQEAAESHLVEFFEECNMCCKQVKRVTIAPREIQLARCIKAEA